jgi:hypothetical protein
MYKSDGMLTVAEGERGRGRVREIGTVEQQWHFLTSSFRLFRPLKRWRYPTVHTAQERAISKIHSKERAERKEEEKKSVSENDIKERKKESGCSIRNNTVN